MKNVWNRIKTWARANSKAIGAAVGSLASFLVINLTGHDLDPASKSLIIFVATAAVTWLFPANKETSKVGSQS